MRCGVISAAATNRGQSGRSAVEACTPGPERGDAVAVPADRRVRVPLGLPHRCADRARRRRRLAVRAAVRRAEHLRQPARSRGGHVPLRAVRHQRARRRARYEPGTNVLETTWKTPSGWVVVRGRADMGPTPGPDSGDAAHAPAGRRRRGAHARAHGAVPRRSRGDGAGVRAGVRLRAGAGDVERSSTRMATPPTPSAASVTVRLHTDLSVGIEGDRVRARHVLRAGRTGVLRAVVGGGPRRARRRRRRRGAASPPR